MRDARSQFTGRLRGQDFETAINLERIGADDFAVATLGDRRGQLGFSDGSRAGDDEEWKRRQAHDLPFSKRKKGALESALLCKGAAGSPDLAHEQHRAGALDLAGDLAVEMRGHAGEAAGQDLAALGDELFAGCPDSCSRAPRGRCRSAAAASCGWPCGNWSGVAESWVAWCRYLVSR